MTERVLVTGGAGYIGGGVVAQVLQRGYDGAVMHFAAFIEAGESMKCPAKYFRNNTANALTLLDAVTTHKVPRFVFSSTAALYGTPERTLIEEKDTLRPTNT